MSNDRNVKAPTVDQIEARLIAALRALPDHPVYSSGGALRVSGDAVASETLGWVSRFVPNRFERLTLLTWARCRALGGSASASYTGLGWSRTTAERKRRQALDKIVAGLRSDRGLDFGTTSPGFFGEAEADIGLTPT